MLLYLFLLILSSFINAMDCPPEITLEVAKFVVASSNDIDSTTNTIKALSLTNKSNYYLLNNPQSIDLIANILSQKLNINKPFMVKTLHMSGSKTWYSNFSKTIPLAINEKFTTAIKNNDTKSAYIFLNQGAQVDTIIAGNPAVIYTTIQKNLAATEFLLRNGAQINIQNSHGETAYIWAVKLKSIEMIQLLLASKADKTIATNNGITALDYAMLLE